MKLCMPQEVLNQHLVVLGKTGAGKSSALRHVVEHLLRHKKRICIVDPKGDWWGLKSSADGKSAGFPVIAFGNFKEEQATDIPINPQSGKHVAELITSGNRPCIIGFRGWMPGQMTDFWIDFASTLFNSSQGEMYVVIDEVHNFAPKGKVLDPKAGKVLHWTNRLLSEGRGLGLIFLIASQRPQKVHNDTLTCCETLVAMRVNHAADRQASKDWIDGCGNKEQGTEVLNNLAQLARGEAYVWSPEAGFGPKRLKFPMFETFDSFAPPQLQHKISESGWPDVDLDAVKVKLQAVIEEAKGNDPRELKRQIAELKHSLLQRPTDVIERHITIADPAAVAAAVKQERECLLKYAESYILKMFDAIGKAKDNLEQAHSFHFDPPAHATIAIVPPPHPRPVPARPDSVVTKVTNVTSPANGLGRTPQLMMNVLVSWHPRGVTRGQLAAFVGIKADTGSFRQYLSTLRTSGMIKENGTLIFATNEAVRELAGSVPPPPQTTREVVDLWKPKLGKTPAQMLEVVVSARGADVTREDLAAAVGCAADTGSFRQYLSTLSTAGLIVKAGQMVAANKETLFL